MKKPSEQQELIILAAIVAGVVLTVCRLLVWQPQMTELRALGPKVAQLQQDIERVEVQSQRLDQIRQATDARHTEVRKLTAQFADAGAIDTILQDVTEIAKAANIEVQSLEPIDQSHIFPSDPDEKVPEQFYEEMPVMIWASGGYHQIGDFVNRLERMPRLIRLTHLEIMGNTTELWRQSVRMMISTYRADQPDVERDAASGVE